MMVQRDGLHNDSPRPLLISKSTDGIYVIAIDRSNVPPAYDDESSRRPRLSCDDRQLLLQVEAQDSKMPSSKLRDLPRLSLDSRDESVKSSLCLKNFGYAKTNDSLIDNLKYRESPSCQRASGVIAKLMGLEETLHAPGSARSHRPDHHTQNGHLSHTSRSICHDLGTMQPKIQPTILKTKPSPRIVPEAAPWKQQKISTTRYYAKEGPSSTSINDDVERRLSNLTTPECNKDLRALRILSKLHAKRSDYNARSLNTQKAAAGQTNSTKDFQSPIVIMKPVRGIMKQNDSVATLAGTKVHRKLRHEESPFTTKTDKSDRTKTHSHNPRAHSRQEEDVGSTSSPKPSRILSPRLVQKSDCGRITQLTVPLFPPKTSKVLSPRGRLRSRVSQSNSICGHGKAMIPENKISLSNQVHTSMINYSNTLNVNTSSIHQSNTTSTLNYEVQIKVNIFPWQSTYY